jgi:predicted enzyme related to lactoylglutathione lyase
MSSVRNAQINLYTTDVPRLAAFYERRGFEETFRTPADDAPVHVESTLEHFKLGVASVEAAAADHGLEPQLDGRRVEIVLWTEDVDADHAQLVADGAQSLSEPHNFLGGRLR